MITRYTLSEMGDLWTDFNKKKWWHNVELAALSAKEKLGYAQKGVAASAGRIVVTEKILRRADELEAVGDHDLIAFVLAITEELEKIDKTATVHYHAGLTSFDIEDTALAIVLWDCLAVIQVKLFRLGGILKDRANIARRMLQIGRTHFIHAEPITFGLKLLCWVDVIERHLKRLRLVEEEVAVGKFSGAVGTYALDPRIEEEACESLGLKPARVAAQIISRDILAHYAAHLVAIANSLDRFATEIRHLAGTDIGEVAEHKKPGAKGSSAMPGKSMLRNPIKSENVCGLARVARGYLIPAFECEVVWAERTLENSAAERIYLPDLTILLDFMLARFTDTMEKLEVFPEQMMRNIWRTGGIVFAQRVMLKLTEKGMARAEAYNLLESLALSVERGMFIDKNGKSFKDLVFENEMVKARLSQNEIIECFNPELTLKHIDTIFARFEL